MYNTKTLWSDADRKRHFIIPDDTDLPTGNFELRTVTGRKKNVIPESIAAYEVTREQATEWLKDQFGQVVETAKESILDSIRSKMEQKPDLDAWFGKRTETPPPFTAKPDPKPATSKATADSPWLSLLAELSGESSERLKSDPQAIRRVVRELMAQSGSFFSAATAADETSTEAARERMRQLRNILQQYGFNISPAAEQFPEKLRQAYQSAQQDMGNEEAAQRLEALAGGIEEAASHVVTWLRDQAKTLRDTKVDKSSPESSTHHQDSQTTTSNEH